MSTTGTLSPYRPTIQQKTADTGLRVWNGNPVMELDDQECRDYARYMWRKHGILYLDLADSF